MSNHIPIFDRQKICAIVINVYSTFKNKSQKFYAFPYFGTMFTEFDTSTDPMFEVSQLYKRYL